MQSLGVDGATGYAIFTGKANIQDLTDPDNPVSVSGNKTLQMEMYDNGGGPTDLIGFTLYDNSGELWYSSNWDGTETALQNLNQGNVNVNAGGNGNGNIVVVPGSPQASTGKQQVDSLVPAPELSVFPNPFTTQATIRIVLPQSGQVSLEVFNLSGQRVWRHDAGRLDAGSYDYSWDGTGNNSQLLSAGMYLVRMRVGDEVLMKRVSLAR